MAEFEIEICIVASLLPAEYVRYVNTLHNDAPYAATDEIPDVPVTVEYDQGWYQAGNRSGHPDTWEPDSGEDAEIISVSINEDDYKGENTLSLDGTDHHKELVTRANEDQETNADDGHW